MANVMSGHSDQLTKVFTKSLSILTDPQYLWNDVFPLAFVGATSANDESVISVQSEQEDFLHSFVDPSWEHDRCC